jgi:hypothetical protein
LCKGAQVRCGLARARKCRQCLFEAHYCIYFQLRNQVSPLACAQNNLNAAHSYPPRPPKVQQSGQCGSWQGTAGSAPQLGRRWPHLGRLFQPTQRPSSLHSGRVSRRHIRRRHSPSGTARGPGFCRVRSSRRRRRRRRRRRPAIPRSWDARGPGSSCGGRAHPPACRRRADGYGRLRVGPIAIQGILGCASCWL